MDIKRHFQNVVRKVFRWIFFNLKKVENDLKNNRRNYLLEKIQSGTDCKLNGENWVINYPERLILGNNVHIGDEAFIDSSGGIHIGDNTHISRRVSIYSSNHNYHGMVLPYDNSFLHKPVHIGKNVWIGMEVSIVPGVTIGDGCVIGMGALINKDVKPLSVVGNQSFRVLKQRNQNHYITQENSEYSGGVNGFPIRTKNFNRNLQNYDGKLVIVLGTGRSGTKAITDSLKQVGFIDAKHEPIVALIKISDHLARNLISAEDAEFEIRKIFSVLTIEKNASIAVLSDQKFWNLIPILIKIKPSAIFIHLIRDGRKVVRSIYSRNWYDDNDYLVNRNIWSQYRLDGAEIGSVSKKIWNTWDAFTKCCWYWSYLNFNIAKSFQSLPNNQGYSYMLEDIPNSSFCKLFDLDDLNFEFKVSNQVRNEHLKKYHFEWTEKHEEKFLKIGEMFEEQKRGRQ